MNRKYKSYILRGKVIDATDLTLLSMFGLSFCMVAGGLLALATGGLNIQHEITLFNLLDLIKYSSWVMVASFVGMFILGRFVK
jgi:hypothetical protein